MPDYLHAQGLSERQRLEHFPSFVEDTVSQALDERYIDAAMIDYLRKAWAELRDTGELERLAKAIRDAEDDDLAAHGLVGAQGEAKRRNVERWYNRFRQKARTWILKRLTGALRAIVDTLFDLLGIGGALREFLDLLNDSFQEEAEAV
jgi:hypothetical protein